MPAATNITPTIASPKIPPNGNETPRKLIPTTARTNATPTNRKAIPTILINNSDKLIFLSLPSFFLIYFFYLILF